MRKTITPERKDYKSTLGNGEYQTNYGRIQSWDDGDWYHYSFNQQNWRVGEEWWGTGHEYNICL